jgi:quaternary ammonium compound-resistance protein SugE
MSWILLVAAGLVEVVMAMALKQADAWTRPLPSAIGVVAALGSVFLLTLALRRLPLGVAYAVWTAIGAVGVVLAGRVWFGESLSAPRLACIGLVVVGVVGLRVLEA